MKELTGLEWVVFILFMVLLVSVLLYVLKDIVATYLETYGDGDEEENRDEGQ